MAATMEARKHIQAYDESLVGDDYEVIEPNVLVSENHIPEPEQKSLWTLKQNITLDGNMSMDISTIPHVPSIYPDQTTLTEERPHEEETPVLDGSTVNQTVSDRTLNGSLDSWDSNQTIEGMLASQAETKQLLTESISKIEQMSFELVKLDELKKEVEGLRKEVEEKNNQIASLNNATLAEKINQEQSLMHDLYTKGLEIDQRNETIQILQNRLDAANRTITDLQKQVADISANPGSQRQSTENTKYLNDQLDEMCAKYLQEKELRGIVEEQLNSIQQGRPLLADECGMAGQVRLRNQQVESLETRVKLLDEEISSKDEIIKVLREDHLEGNRMIAEKEHRISELERRIELMDQRLQLDSS